MRNTSNGKSAHVVLISKGSSSIFARFYREMKFRYRRLSNLELNYSRLPNSFEFLLNADKETQNNLHVHCKTITFLAQIENKKNVKARMPWRTALLALTIRDISLFQSFTSSSISHTQSLKEFRFVRVQVWIEQILTRGAFIVFFITTNWRNQTTHLWGRRMMRKWQGRPRFFCGKTNFAWLIDWA